VDSQEVAQVPAGPRSSGRVVLWCHTDADIAISRLTIEGRPTPAYLTDLRGRWVEQQFASWDRPAEGSTGR
jgi:hypothetical protein